MPVSLTDINSYISFINSVYVTGKFDYNVFWTEFFKNYYTAWRHIQKGNTILNVKFFYDYPLDLDKFQNPWKSQKEYSKPLVIDESTEYYDIVHLMYQSGSSEERMVQKFPEVNPIHDIVVSHEFVHEFVLPISYQEINDLTPRLFSSECFYSTTNVIADILRHLGHTISWNNPSTNKWCRIMRIETMMSFDSSEERFIKVGELMCHYRRGVTRVAEIYSIPGTVGISYM